MDADLCRKLMDNISRVVVGKKEAIEMLLVALLAEGHVLIEDVPGVGKTLLAKSLARSINGVYKRVQFTPDLLPADITGFNVFNPQSGEFDFKPGPVTTHIMLADEINRTIPRTQASLLESMEERQVTVDGKTMPLPRPFFVMATQNPIELEGTFPLPEAQLDRFLLKIHLGYPDDKEEIAIMEQFQTDDPLQSLTPVAEPSEIEQLQETRKKIHVSGPVKKYIADMIAATRHSGSLRYGASPRGSLGLMRAAQALALIRNRDYTLPDDVKTLALAVLAHRVVLKDEDKLRDQNPADVIQNIIGHITIPIDET
jgi:MoxR-like ATPase